MLSAMTDSENVLLSRWHEESKETNNKAQDLPVVNTTPATRSKANLTNSAPREPEKDPAKSSLNDVNAENGKTGQGQMKK